MPSVLEPDAWRTWFAGRDALTIVFAMLRLLTLVMAWYLAGVTLFGLVARLVRSSRLVAVANAVAVPAVRRLLQAAFGAGLATASLAAGSSSAPADLTPPAVTAEATTDPIAELKPVDDEVLMTPAPPAQVLQPVSRAPIPTASERQRDADTWIVRPGDHLWSIAERTLATSWGRSPRDDETADYWERLIARNRSRLIDPGNPDLIFAGQVFELPPVPPR